MTETARWQVLDRDHHLHPFTDHKALAEIGSRVIIRAEGCWLWDSEGNRNLGYHGVTMAAASLSGLTPMHPESDLPLPGFEHIAAPYWYGEGGDLTPEAFGRLAAAALEERIVQLDPDKVAVFIGEPIQGAGGVIVPPDGYWQEIQRICKRHDVLLIADEVICGFGRTGRWWGSDTFGITPDIMTIAKGLSSGYLPISAVLIGDRVGDALAGSGEEWVHGFTYSGHPIATSVALANIGIIEDEGLHRRADGPVGEAFATMLASLDDHPLVGETRSVGLVGAIELVADKALRKRFPEERGVGLTCRGHCLGNGLVMRAVGDIMVLAPPLIITEDEVGEIGERARHALDLTASDLGL